MKIINFVDFAESETTPTIGNIVASSVVQYVNDVAYVAAEQGAPLRGNLYYNTTDENLRYYNGTTWQELIDENSVQALENKAIDADTNLITNIDNNEIKPLAGIDATKLADGSVTNTELQYINTLSSNVQTQLGAKLSLSGGTMTGNILANTDGSRVIGSASKNFGDLHAQSLQSNTDLYISAPIGAGITFAEADIIDFTGIGELDVTGVALTGFPSAGNSWSDFVDSDIIPDGVLPRQIGNDTNNFETVKTHGIVSNDDLLIASAIGNDIVFEQAGNVDFTGVGAVDFTGVAVTGLSSSGANTSLSNLGVTNINASLLPQVNTASLGGSVNVWEFAFIEQVLVGGGGNNGNIELRGGTGTQKANLRHSPGSSNTPTGATTDIQLDLSSSSINGLSIHTSNTTASAKILVETGNSSAGDSGNIAFTIGTATGTQGDIILLKAGTPPTVSDVWTCTNVDGSGYWAAPAGGAPATTTIIQARRTASILTAAVNHVQITNLTEDFDTLNEFAGSVFSPATTGVYSIEMYFESNTFDAVVDVEFELNSTSVYTRVARASGIAGESLSDGRSGKVLVSLLDTDTMRFWCFGNGLARTITEFNVIIKREY